MTTDFLDRIKEPAKRLLELQDNPEVYANVERDLSVAVRVFSKYHRVGLFPLVDAIRKGQVIDPLDPRMRVRRQNSTHLLQVGDTLRNGRVTAIVVGTTRDNAKNGESTASVDYTLMRSDSFAEKVILSLKDDLNQGYWRRGTQISPTPHKGIIDTKLELRHWLRQANACMNESRRLRNIGKETGEQIVLTSRIITAIKHELSSTPVHMEPSQSPPGERAYLRSRIRDIEALVNQERGRETVFDMHPRFDVWKACNEERDACIEALRDIRREERQVAKAAIRAMR